MPVGIKWKVPGGVDAGNRIKNAGLKQIGPAITIRDYKDISGYQK
jgi:hypothetical protein